MIDKPGSYTWDYLKPHSILGVEKGRQGAGQTLPEDNVLCYTCGWMTVSDYLDHITDIVDDYIKDVI